LKRITALGAALVAALVVTASAMAHAEISPNLVQAKEDQLFTLVVPGEEESATTVRVDLLLPEGFEIDSYVANRDWNRIAADRSVTWNGGNIPDGEAAAFQFVGSTESAQDYTFTVRQIYSDGSVVEWSGAPDSDTPAPVVEAKSDVSGGGGTSTTTWIALVLGAAGLVLGLVALVTRGGRGTRELA
jgi:uncharacterized protein YcnI